MRRTLLRGSVGAPALLWISVLVAWLGACATVDVTKTAKGIFPPTDPNDVEILTTFPRDRPFEEIATISTTKWKPSESAKMHNALRAKAAPLGANAVVLANSGISGGNLWSTGAAIRFTTKK
jgi:hypothetical protein